MRKEEKINPFQACRQPGTWHLVAPNVVSREKRPQESHGNAVPVPHSSMQVPDRRVSLSPSNSSVLITAYFSFALRPSLPCGSSRYEFWRVGSGSEGAALPRHGTCSEELPGHAKGSNHSTQWLHTGLKTPRWHSSTQELLLSIPSLI